MTRIAVVEREKCNPTGCGDYLCIKLCPVNRTGKECITKHEMKVRIDEALCTGCGICQNRCPFDAISIINLPKELDQDPIHQYGENGFRLYSLPAPIFGKVIGVVGVNGIGKSTAIKILAGVLTPNFGKIDDEKVDYEKLIEHFKGTEAQNFFEAVRDGRIAISYKPQKVDLIPKQHKGKIIDLLQKVDEKGKLNDIVKQLEIDHILENNIQDVSGGELQRVAIAATVLKKANLYIFDELTSYLDIKQRLRISRFIRSLADEDTAVMVIEHDLIALDYMTDLVHIMYGKKSCYGIVSMPKTNKAGINVYLEGYLKEENVRFRDKKITFEVRPPLKAVQKETLVSWKEFKETFGQFTLTATEGMMFRKEIVGVLGENGIGKTSFVKTLSEKIGSGKNLSGNEMGVSYKSQYLEGTEELVQSYLAKAIEKYKTLIVEPLKIDSLMMRKLNDLSGGELQSVMIAKALSEECDILLLDEPSAYLDVEQRLVVSKVIRNIVDQKGISAMIVDHDLLFIDYLSDRLLTFEGKPGITGTTHGPYGMEKGMNSLLKEVNITLRRDEHSKRPRINKRDSRKDQEQKKNGNYYYGA